MLTKNHNVFYIELRKYLKRRKTRMFPNSNLPNLATKTEEFIINIENNIPKPLFEMSVFEVLLSKG